MEMMVSLVTLAGMAYAAFRGLKWMTRASQAVTNRDRQLSPTDLKVLEETAERLMADLRAVAEETVARIGRAVADAENRLAACDAHQPEERGYVASQSPVLIDPDRPAAEAAKLSGLMTGEVELIRSLNRIGVG